MEESSLFTPIPFLESIWQHFLTFSWITPISSNQYENAAFLAIAVVPMVWFYLYGAWFYWIDNHTSEQFKYQYKVQNNIRITSNQYHDAFWISIRNWFVLGLPYLFGVCKVNTLFMQQLDGALNYPPIPSIYLLIRDLIIYVLIEEVMFYFSHRVLHWSFFYTKIHKFHHKFTAPCAIAAIYAHPIEHMLSNVIPVATGPLVMKSHPITSMIWGLLALFNTMTVHSGYDFTSWIVFPAPYFHDWHHERFNENFGATTLLDQFFGTNKNYLETIARGEMFAPRKAKRLE